MIELTVKTLDSANHSFEVDDETTVAQLKERIREALGFELNNQRLIFCGRVLTDDQVLKAAGIDSGKCIHLVERPPPSPTSRRRDRDRMEGGHGGDHGGRPPNQQQTYTIRMTPRQQMAYRLPTAGRLNSIRTLIIEIRVTLATLTLTAGDLVAIREVPQDVRRSRNNRPERMDTEMDLTSEAYQQAERARRERERIPEHRDFPTSPHDLGMMIEELDYLHNLFAPYREEYVAMLRTLASQNYTEAERRQRQDVVRLTCDIMHSFAHCYHSISDITFNVSRNSPRLNSEQPSTRNASQPLQAQINIIAATGPRSMSGDRRGAGAGAAAAATTATTTTTTTGGARPNVNVTRAPSTQASTPRPAAAPPVAPSEPAIVSDTFHVRPNPTVRTPVHTTTRTCRRPGPDATTMGPIEVETRGNIPVAGENNIAEAFSEAYEQHERAVREVLASQANEAARSNPIPAPSSNRRRQNLPPGLISLDNLDSVSRAVLIAAEARMVAETRMAAEARIAAEARMAATATSALSAPPPSAPAAPAAQTASGSTFLASAPINIGPRSAPVQGTAPPPLITIPRGLRARNVRGARTGQSPGQAQVHIAGVSRLSDQSNDGSRPRVLMDVENMVRNLAESVGMEVVMSMEELPNVFSTAGLDDTEEEQIYVSPLNAAHNVGGTPTADLLQNILAIVRNRLMPQDPPQNQGQLHNRGPGQAQNQRQSPNQESVQSNAERRNQWQAPWGGPIRLADNMYPFDPSCMEYDRFLDCDSAFAREQLQGRRLLYRQQVAEERLLDPRTFALPEIGEITNRNSRFTPVHMVTMTRLLNDSGSEQAQLNAVMIIVARQVFLQPENSYPGTTGPIPAEFPLIRVMLRNYVRGQLNLSAARGRVRDPFEAFAERLLGRAEAFLTDIPSMEQRAGDSTIEIDPNVTFRAFMDERLPNVIAWLMSDTHTEIVATRLYIVVYKFFVDLITLFMGFLENDFDRLVRIYDDFIAMITEDYGSSTRDWLRLLCHENVRGIQFYAESNSNARHIRQYFRRVNGSAVPPQTGLPCCQYEAMRQGRNVMQYRSFLAGYCATHLRQVLPMQAPPLLPPLSSSDDDSSKTSTPTTTRSRRQCDGSGSDNQASGPHAGSLQRSQDSSTTGSPSHSRSEPMLDVEVDIEAESEEESYSDTSPRRLRRWGPQSPNDSQSLASDLTSESHPPGIMVIPPGPDTDSLCDVEELDVDAIVDDVDPYVCEYTTVRRAVVYSPLNIIEDDAVEVNEDEEVDIETIEDDSTTLADDLETSIRREQRERSIRRDVARRRQEGEIRHKRLITLHETEERIDERNRHLATWQKNFNKGLDIALGLEEKRRLLEEQDEEDDEVSENESSEQEDIMEDDNTTTRSNPELERLLRQREIMLAKIELGDEGRDSSLCVTLREELASLREAGDTDVANRLATLMREMGFLDNEPGEPILGPQPGPSTNYPPPILVPGSNDSVSDGNDFESDDKSKNQSISPTQIGSAQGAEVSSNGNGESKKKTMSPTQNGSAQAADDSSDGNDESDDSLSPTQNDSAQDADDSSNGNDESDYESDDESVSPTQNGPAQAADDSSDGNDVNDGNDFESDDESIIESISPTQNGSAQGADDSSDSDVESYDESNDECISPTQNGSEQGAGDNWYSLPSFRSPNSELLHNNGYYSPQLCMYHGRPGFLTPQPISVNAASMPSDNEGNDEFNSMVSHLRIDTRESSEPVKVALQTPQHTRKDHKQLATEIADGAQTSNAETGCKDIPHTSDDLNLATQAPMDGIEEEDMPSVMGRWEPVLREDSAAQACGGQTQPPFSDAYMTGMPAPKRRCVDDERPPTSLNQLLNEGLLEVSEGVPGELRGGEAQAELTQLLRESVRDLVAARALDEPEDYQPSRFPNAAAFIASADRTMTKEADDRTPTPPKKDAPDSAE